MSEKLIWFPFYAADYLADTQRLTTTEHGAYLLVLISFWFSKGQMDYDDESFAAICKCSIEDWRTKLRPKLEPFFKVKDGKWFHSRVIREYERAESLSEMRQKIGKMGGRPKTNRLTNSLAKANQLGNQNETQSQSHERENNRKSPTVEEVLVAAAKIQLPESEARKFHAHYESNGWKVGKNPMKSVNGALAGWKLRWQEQYSSNGNSTQTPQRELKGHEVQW